jgi:hypothetical protein
MPFNTEVSYLKRVQESKKNLTQASDDYFQDVSIPYPMKYLLPGHVYTFEFISDIDSPDIITIEEYLQSDATKKAMKKAGVQPTVYTVTKPYYDLRPIALSINNLGDSGSEYILNLKCMTYVDRMKVMEILYRGVVPNLLRNGLIEFGSEKGDLLPFQTRLNKQAYTSPFVGFQMRNLTDYLGTGIYFWVNKYDKNRMRNIRLIDFDHLDRLAGLNYANDPYTRFNGTNLVDVQDMYLSGLKNEDSN